MYSSYFFVPADKLSFVEKISSFQADFFILDMEESVSKNAFDNCIGNIKTLQSIKENYFIRIPVDYNDCKDAVNIIGRLYRIGFRTFLLPKLNTYQDFDGLIKQIPDTILKQIKFGLLVESPQFLIEFYTVAKAFKNLICLVMIGSHDYCNTIGCKHTEDNLLYIKLKLLVECKALNIPIVDSVSTDFSNAGIFEKECERSFNSGFDGRAIIHPNQLNAFNNARYYTKDEVIEAVKVKAMVDRIDKDSFSTLNIEGKLYEKPHLKRIYNIAEWHQKHPVYDF